MTMPNSGATPVERAGDLGAVADTVSALGALLLAKPEIREIDLNPLVVYPRGAVALDALISL